jgi:16S rRNA (cytosine1402-N4)-methyltransferase
VGIDRDPSVDERFGAFAAEVGADGLDLRFIGTPFPDAFATLAREGVSANAVILDVGVSSMQIDQPERGFSYATDAPLDMRMDPRHGASAADLVNGADAGELERWLRDYGDEKFARRIAQRIVERRVDTPFERTADFADVVRGAIPAGERHKRRGDPAKRTFQALRIAVNDELGMLDRALDAALDLLAPDGRLAVISFHSLEDRMVKQRFVAWEGRCTCPPGIPVCGCGAKQVARTLTKRAVAASDAELAVNPRASSAKLRVAQKVAS